MGVSRLAPPDSRPPCPSLTDLTSTEGGRGGHHPCFAKGGLRLSAVGQSTVLGAPGVLACAAATVAVFPPGLADSEAVDTWAPASCWPPIWMLPPGAYAPPPPSAQMAEPEPQGAVPQG